MKSEWCCVRLWLRLRRSQVVLILPVDGSANNSLSVVLFMNKISLKPAFYITSVLWLECVYSETQMYQQIITREDSGPEYECDAPDFPLPLLENWSHFTLSAFITVLSK
jgi:hypothetical protein